MSLPKWHVQMCMHYILSGAVLKANALNTPPGKYDRKIKTQRNWRGLAQAVEHVV